MTRTESKGFDRLIVGAMLWVLLVLAFMAFGYTQQGHLDAGEKDTFSVAMRANHVYVIALEAEDDNARFKVTICDPDGDQVASIHADEQADAKSRFVPNENGNHEVEVKATRGSSEYELKIIDKGEK